VAVAVVNVVAVAVFNKAVVALPAEETEAVDSLKKDRIG
jgi:hypothetical protein